MKKIAFLLCLCVASLTQAQYYTPADSLLHNPVEPSALVKEQMMQERNPIIVERLDEWQDLKFGFMIHWGMYAQWGVVESWSICSEPWISRGGQDYLEYVLAYRQLNRTFNPRKFDATRWAKIAKDAGMRYVVFTAKHHDGFCMFNSKYTNYTVCDKSCPYAKHAQSDITKDVVDAFRAKGMWTGLYFSKPDWHHPDYWAPEWATPDRNVNYDPEEFPTRWQQFCDFTHNQVYELTHNYGGIDILWLDGGWIRPAWSLTEESREWLGCRGRIQDINMPRLASIAREKIPDLLIVDRSVGGRYENYRTPEQTVPDTVVLDYPWETCMSMGDSWSWMKNDHYKSTNELIHTLVDVVAKGGNLLLNVGPDANGTLPDTAVARMKEIGAWMKDNSDAIYATRPVLPYSFEKWRFTQSKDGSKFYALYLMEPGEELPEVFTLPYLPRMPQKCKVLGGGSAKVRSENGQYSLYIRAKNAKHALVVAFE